MTEQEWLTCDDSATMLEFVRVKTTRRKLRLFAAAAFRRLTGLLPDNRQRQAIEMLEAMHEDVEERRDVVSGVRQALPSSENSYTAIARDDPYFVGLMLYRELVSSTTAHHATLAPAGLADGAKEQLEQARLLRCVLGPLPFRPVTLDPTWLTPTVHGLAESIYDNRAFNRMPVLADALEEAGCYNAYILNHLRQPGVHVRGCWAVDLVLGKE
jgi:hypothetical protein